MSEKNDTGETTTLSKTYDPQQVEGPIYELWLESGAFHATPDERPRDRRYVVMMPLPNVTGALHMGHAIDNAMQDLLIRWHRLRGDNTLYMPGTDHAGIATQAVVEKRLKELEGKTRHDVGRKGLVERIWQWKDQYQARIIAQQQRMGCSCDWERQRFTMDPVCARAVRQTFFRMFGDGLIFRGKRLINWDPFLRTSISDDEVYHETVQGHFWHLRYPVIDPQPGEPEAVEVATTRPETMLGDTAVAVHPDPDGALQARAVGAERAARARLGQGAPGPAGRARGAGAAAHRGAAAPAQAARHGRRRPPGAAAAARPADPADPRQLGQAGARLGLRQDHAGPRPQRLRGLDPPPRADRDHQHPAARRLAQRRGGPYAGLDRFEARARVVADLEAQGLLPAVEDREVEIGHSDRSKTPVEPYLSDQWFVRMGDVEGGVTMGRGTAKEHVSPGLVQAAMDAVLDGRVKVHPERYAKTYLDWLGEKRDWPISRQLWWGHRIPIWSRELPFGELDLSELRPVMGAGALVRIQEVAMGAQSALVQDTAASAPLSLPADATCRVDVCLLADDDERLALLEAWGYAREEDVLDTWFSSALWPYSTLGWPAPETAPIEEGQAPLGPVDGADDCLDYYYPGSCLVTARDIITLWVARMVLAGEYNLGDIPFSDVFIHANILDGKGEKMSKTKGNGIDPVDIIEAYGTDAMRYVLCDMQTGNQDIRLPVTAICPACGQHNDLEATAHGGSIFTYVCGKPLKGKGKAGCGAEFDVLGTLPDLPRAKLISKRFEVGRAFCTKLWNSARFALMNLEPPPPVETPAELQLEDRWILDGLSQAVRAVERGLADYNPSAALHAAREFFWSSLCDWYLELIKPRLQDPDDASGAVARQVLAFCLDQVLRLLHPFVPFITEQIWQQLGRQVPRRSLGGLADPPVSEHLINARWPVATEALEDPELRATFADLQALTRAVREVRSAQGLPPRQPVTVTLKPPADRAASIEQQAHVVTRLAGIEQLHLDPAAGRTPGSASKVVGDLQIFVHDVIDDAAERTRLEQDLKKIEKEIATCEKKLSNPKFVDRAPPAVVKEQQDRLADYKGQQAATQASLRELA